MARRAEAKKDAPDGKDGKPGAPRRRTQDRRRKKHRLQAQRPHQARPRHRRRRRPRREARRRGRQSQATRKIDHAKPGRQGATPPPRRTATRALPSDPAATGAAGANDPAGAKDPAATGAAGAKPADAAKPGAVDPDALKAADAKLKLFFKGLPATPPTKLATMTEQERVDLAAKPDAEGAQAILRRTSRRASCRR